MVDDYFLQSRKDPFAVRGEMRFVQACLGCHQVQPVKGGAHSPLPSNPLSWPPIWRKVISASDSQKMDELHQGVSGVPRLNQREKRALKSFLDTLLVERKRFASRPQQEQQKKSSFRFW